MAEQAVEDVRNVEDGTEQALESLWLAGIASEPSEWTLWTDTAMGSATPRGVLVASASRLPADRDL
jgi:hypothetical protein